MPRGGNHNVTGKNQFGTLTSADDPILREALQRYHREGYTNNKTISELLLADFGIKLSESTVKRRRWVLGLFGSGKATKEIPEDVKRQMVIDAMGDDPKQHRGPRTIKQEIAQRTGIHLTRDFIHAVMQEVAPEGFALRKPPPKRTNGAKPRAQSSSSAIAGPHQRWCVDHHSKLSGLRMEIFGIRDKASGKWLGLWAVPNGNLKDVVAYLYLCVVEAYQGIPVQTTTECATSTNPPAHYEFAEALEALFFPQEGPAEDPLNVFMESVQQINVDKGWFGFSVGWGDNIVTFFESGVTRGIYHPDDQEHFTLAQWLWSTFLRTELLQIRDQMNSARILKRASNKDSPTIGATPNAVYSLPQKYNMVDCLRRLDLTPPPHASSSTAVQHLTHLSAIHQLKHALGGDALLEFVTVEYAMKADQSFRELCIPGLNYHNIWDVFALLVPTMCPEWFARHQQQQAQVQLQGSLETV